MPTNSRHFGKKWLFLRLRVERYALQTRNWYTMYFNAISKDFAQFIISSMIIVVWAQLPMLIPTNLALSFYTLSTSWIMVTNVAGPFVGPNSITLYVHLIALGPIKGSFSCVSLNARI
jgi:hypothetical protein